MGVRMRVGAVLVLPSWWNKNGNNGRIQGATSLGIPWFHSGRLLLNPDYLIPIFCAPRQTASRAPRLLETYKVLSINELHAISMTVTCSPELGRDYLRSSLIGFRRGSIDLGWQYPLASVGWYQRTAPFCLIPEEERPLTNDFGLESN